MPNQIRSYEPLTSENAALVLIDHQVGLMTGVRDISTGELKHNVVALAKAAKALKLPIVVTTTARESMWGPTFPELVEALPEIPIGRSVAHAASRRDCVRLCEPDGRDPKRQHAIGGRRRLRCDRHALGEACWSDRASLRQIMGLTYL
jgi:hypothetical protein